MFKLTSRSITENENTAADARCAVLSFSEIQEPGNVALQIGSCTLVMTREQAAQYAFGVDYEDPSMTTA